jgi:hypothetical protein
MMASPFPLWIGVPRRVWIFFLRRVFLPSWQHVLHVAILFSTQSKVHLRELRIRRSRQKPTPYPTPFVHPCATLKCQGAFNNNGCESDANAAKPVYNSASWGRPGKGGYAGWKSKELQPWEAAKTNGFTLDCKLQVSGEYYFVLNTTVMQDTHKAHMSRYART